VTRPARPTPTPLIRFLSIGSCICSALPSDPISRWQPLRFAILHLHQVGAGTLTPLAVEHARHTGCARYARRLTPRLTAAVAAARQSIKQSSGRLLHYAAIHDPKLAAAADAIVGPSIFSFAHGTLSTKVCNGVLP
jgi:hypothetical protein